MTDMTETNKRIVLSSVNLLDGENPAKAQQTVVIEGQRILKVCADGEFKSEPDDQIINADGYTLMPGMFQSHWHGSYKDLDFECVPVGLEKPPGYLMLLAQTQSQLALDYGFTSVTGAAVGDGIDAQLKMAIDDGLVKGPRIIASGRWLVTTGDSNDLPEYNWWGITSMGGQRICDGADEFRRGARQEIKEGAEVIKIFNDSGHALLYGTQFLSMTRDELNAVVEATHQRGKLVRSHVTGKQAILDCIEAGVDILDHCDHVDEECLEKIIEDNVYVCPSVYLLKMILEVVGQQDDGVIDEPFFVEMQQDYDHMQKILPKAVEMGAKFLVGDDWGTKMTPHGDYNKEMQLYVDCGVPPLEVIKWATKNAAESVRLDKELGTVEEGKLADLLVVKGDPSQDITLLDDRDNILAIMQSGSFYKNALL